jgi:energy-coupling factor transporter ATP-binding protein EcfA2
MTVSNRGAVRYVFTSSHTSRGFYTYIPDLVNSIGQVYILKGAPGSGKSTFVRLLGEMLVEQGYDVEFWISAVEAVTPEGVYIPQLDAAIVNGSLPQPVDPRYPGSHHLVNLEDYWDEERLKAYKAEVMELVDDIEDSSQQAYFYLKEASRVKERIRNIYSSRLNLGKVEELLKNISTEIMENAVQEKHYFAGRLHRKEWLIIWMN